MVKQVQVTNDHNTIPTHAGMQALEGGNKMFLWKIDKGGGPVPAVSFVPVMAADIITTKPYQHQFGQQNAALREAVQWCTPFILPELGFKCT